MMKHAICCAALLSLGGLCQAQILDQTLDLTSREPFNPKCVYSVQLNNAGGLSRHISQAVDSSEIMITGRLEVGKHRLSRNDENVILSHGKLSEYGVVTLTITGSNKRVAQTEPSLVYKKGYEVRHYGEENIEVVSISTISCDDSLPE